MSATDLMQSDGHVPDVLETIAQLPNDDVYTPPKVVTAMLNILPEHVWREPDYRWLDPATKSGIYLREAFKRLMVGLADWEPDGAKRREHILKNMLFGAATTEINGEIARRTLYQTRDATGLEVKDPALEDLVVHFDDPAGNLLYVETDHPLDSKQKFCTICRAPATLIRDRRESFAYSFIHGTYPTKELATMKFDVIVGNPPYQIGTEGHGATASPIYHLFVQRAIALEPKYVLFITPSRWFAGGKGLDSFRDEMLGDRRVRKLVDYPNATEVFPSVEIKGGVSYFLWDRDWDGDCAFVSVSGGRIASEKTRDLRDGQGVVIRDNNAVSIVKKVREAGHKTVDTIASVTKPFGLTMRSNYPGSVAEPFEGSIPLIYSSRVGYSRSDQIQRNHEWIDRWKVLLPMAYGGGNNVEGHAVYGEPIALAPGSACTQTYFIVGMFETREETRNFAEYLTTKFVRFLVLQRKITQHITPDRFMFVPVLDFTRRWSDCDLFAEFGLNESEISYIERTVGERNWIDSLDSPIPSTHLPGGRKFRESDPEVEEDIDE